MDPALSYGLVEYLRTLEMLSAIWLVLAAAASPTAAINSLCISRPVLGLFGNESYPHVFQPFGGFGDNIPVIDGRIQPPQSPGIGFELKADLMAELGNLFD